MIQELSLPPCRGSFFSLFAIASKKPSNSLWSLHKNPCREHTIRRFSRKPLDNRTIRVYPCVVKWIHYHGLNIRQIKKAVSLESGRNDCKITSQSRIRSTAPLAGEPLRTAVREKPPQSRQALTERFCNSCPDRRSKADTTRPCAIRHSWGVPQIGVKLRR